MKSEPTRIHSVTRAVELLVVLAETPLDVRKPRNLAQAAGMTVSSTYHILNTFEDAGLLSKDTSGCYQFGPTFAFLAEAHYRNDRLPAAVVAVVRDLAARTGESAYFSVWQQGKIEMLTFALGSNAVHVAELSSAPQGLEHARASGKLLLALNDASVIERFLRTDKLASATQNTISDPAKLAVELEQIRDQGYATEFEEFIEGVGCASAPIYALGRVYGALTISAPIERFQRNIASLVEEACKAAAGVEVVPEQGKRVVKSVGAET